MATVQITTWDEFKTALTETITENTTYEIMNDIDVSGDIQTTRINCVSAYDKIFNGNNHKINGITNYNSSSSGVFGFSLLNTGGAFTFNNISFSNFQCTSIAGGFFYFYTSVTSSKQPAFNNCFFNGECKFFARGNTGSVAPRANFNNCSFNIGIMQVSYTEGYNPLYLTNCYILLKSLTPLKLGSSDISTPFFNTLTNCYIGGDIDISSASSTGSSYQRQLFASNGYNTVINCNINCTATTGAIYLFLGTSTTCLFNNDKYTGSITPTFTSGTATQTNYKLTDAQMKNATYIANNTTFPIATT